MTQYLTEREAASLMRLSPATLANWRWLERGPTWHKVEGRVLYARTDLARYLEGARQ